MKKICGLVFILFSCAPSTLPKYSKLENLRILGLVASNPDPAVGATVGITAVVSYVNKDAAESLTYKIKGCADPGVSRGIVPTCEGGVDVFPEQTGSINFTTAANTDALSAVNITIPATFLDGLTGAALVIGKRYMVTYTVTSSNGAKSEAFKILTVSANTNKNTNPVLNNAMIDNAPLSSLPTTATTMIPSYTDASRETYLGYTGETKQEELITTWFTSDGNFRTARTLLTNIANFEPPAARPTTRPAAIVVFTRDERGGAAVKVYNNL